MANKFNSDYDKRFDKIDTQLDKISEVVIKGFGRIDDALEKKADKSDIQKIYALLDRISKQQEIDKDERLVMGHQLERLDKWVHEVAAKIGYKLIV